MPVVEAITAVSPALQRVARLLHTSPYVAHVILPRASAEQRAALLMERYPTTTAHRNVRSALRVSGFPVVQAVVMPPQVDCVSVLLLTNIPPDDREVWHVATDAQQPLRWRAYEVTTAARIQAEADKVRRPYPRRVADSNRLTWRLAAHIRQDYRTQITRIIHSTKPSHIAQPGTGPRHGTTRTLDGQSAALERLGRHLRLYPGLNGVNTDRWLLKLHMERLWRQQHSGFPSPSWPHYPYLSMLPAPTAPLAHLWPNESLEVHEEILD